MQVLSFKQRRPFIVGKHKLNNPLKGGFVIEHNQN